MSLDANLRNSGKGNGIVVPGWIIKAIIPLFGGISGALGVGYANTAQDQSENRAAVIEACEEVNELRETLRNILLISANDAEGVQTRSEQEQLGGFLQDLRAKECE